MSENKLNKFKLGDTIMDIEDVEAQTRLNNLAKVATSGSYTDLSNKPSIPTPTTIDSTLSPTSTNPVQNKVVTEKFNSLSTVATTGSYNDLSNKPTIPTPVNIDSTLSANSTNPVQNKVITQKFNTLKTVATTGSYSDLLNKPTITYNSELKEISFNNF